MAQNDIRPSVVALITDLDLARCYEPNAPYHRDGRPFTNSEYDLFSTRTTAETDIADAHMDSVAGWMSFTHCGRPSSAYT
ncbi:hypothetical protein ACIQVO_31740 [Streptomyces sp. NPDC101062]|uniref:hypothetical protein n=1 Tax=unclassified Streptomyces TaxID=2593676 RepID=UPI0037FF535B